MEPARTYRPQLDGLRAIAATAVVVAHSGWNGHYGHQAVRLFFVLSGFLITGYLLDAKQNSSGANVGSIMRSFYARRALRIFPAYYAYLALAVLVIWPKPFAGLHWQLAYVGNFFLVWGGTEQFLTGHLWSLAVEEQFYLIWPIAILLTPRRALPAMLVIVIACSAFSRTITFERFGEPVIWVVPWVSFDALGLGALLAWFARQPGSARVRPFALACALLSVLPVLVWLGNSAQLSGRYLVFETLWLIPHGCAILGGHLGFGGLLGKLLDNRLSRNLGRISYGIYLYHPLVRAVFDYGFTVMGLRPIFAIPIVAFSFTMPATILVASASWFLLERPILQLKAFFPRSPAGAARVRL